MAMITEEYQAALKANVIGDAGTVARLRDLLEERHGPRSGEIYGALYSVALATAARRAFPGGYTADTRADVIRFVVRMQGAVAGMEDDFKPPVAEAWYAHKPPMAGGLADRWSPPGQGEAD